MRHLKTLARPAKDHRMLADHIAFADRPNRDLIIGVPRLAQNSGEGLRCSAGRVFLRVMMRFNNFNIEFRPSVSAVLRAKAKSVFTPALKFDAKTTGTDLAARSIAASCSAECPVVPITRGR